MSEIVGQIYQDQTIELNGVNAYRSCRFIACRMVVRPNPLAEGPLFPFDHCRFELCVWHLDVTISDGPRWQALREILPVLCPGITVSIE